MAQTEVVQDHQEHRKEIVMCAYGPSRVNNIRKWVEEITGIDCTSKVQEVNESYQLVVDWDNAGFRQTSTLISERHIEKSDSGVLKEIENCDHISIDHERNESTEFKNKLSTVKYNFLIQLFSELPEEISGGYRVRPRRNNPDELRTAAYYEVAEGDDEIQYGKKVIDADPEGFDERRVLKKEADREPGQMYESIGQRPSFQFTLDLIAPNEEMMDTWTEEVIVQLHKILSKISGINQVRYTSCEVTTTKEGECFI